MAPKKKAKTAAPMACFAGAKITVIGANPFQRKLWEAKIGNGTAFLKPSQAASLKEGNDFVVIAAENVDPATVRAKAGTAQLVGERWLTDSIARNERQSAAAHAWGGALDDDESDAAASEAPETKGLVIVAVGLPGAGKSRFHKEYLAKRDVVRCSQDAIGSRDKTKALVEETVRAGKVAYVDRQGYDQDQRSHWVEIAKRCMVEVVALRFTADASTCIARAVARARRGEHDGGLNDPNKVPGIIGRFRNMTTPIGDSEGFDRVYRASEDDDDENVALVDELLGRSPAPTVVPDTQRLDAAVPDTTDAIRAFALAPATQRARPVPGRHGLIADLDRGTTPGARYAAVVDGVLAAGDAAWLIRQAPAAQDPYTGEHGYRLADVSGVIDETARKSGRVCVDAPALAGQIFERLRPALPSTWLCGGLWRLKGLNERLRFLRYGRQGDFFHRHRDGCYERNAGERSFVTLLLYLNEGYRGAWTTVYNPAKYGGGALVVPPAVGMVLLHDHNLYHEVPPLVAGVKHVIRTDVMYERVFE